LKKELARKNEARLLAERSGLVVKYVSHDVIADYNATYNVNYRGQHRITNAAKELGIPLNEIWISEKWRPYEQYILHHEIREIQLRAEGLEPEEAHNRTCGEEANKWRNDAVWQRMVKEISEQDRKTAEKKRRGLS